MTRIEANPAGATLGDLRSLIRYFRSNVGPLWMEWQVGALTLDDSDDILPFRKFLHLLDGSEADVRRISIFGGTQSVREVKALFSAYRRLRRAERRMDQLCRDLWSGATEQTAAAEAGRRGEG